MLWLYILSGILALFVFLLAVPLVLSFSYTDRLTVTARYLFLRFRLVPSREKSPAKKRPAKQKKKGSSPKAHKPDAFENLVEKNGVAGAVRVLASAVRTLSQTVLRLLKGARVRGLCVTAGVTGEDAALAAIHYGEVCAVFYPFYGWLDGHMKLIRPRVDLHADYAASAPTFTASGRLYITTFHAVITALYGVGKLLRDLRGNQENHKGGKKHERAKQSSTDPKQK